MPNGVRLDPKHAERTRAKIQTSQLINRLTSFVNGEVEMTAPQVTAALGLIRKTLPDLSASDVKHIHTKTINDMTDDELIAIAKRSSANGSGQEESPPESDSVH